MLMKKMYLLVWLCLCLSSVNSQIVANDDVTPILNTRNYLNPGFIDSSFRILSNDSLNGEPVNFADVIISLVESSHPGLTLILLTESCISIVRLSLESIR